MLKEKSFQTKDQLIEWANSDEGTDYIITIIRESDRWILFYVDQI